MAPLGRAPTPAHVAPALSPARLARTLWILFTLFIVYGTTIPFDFSVGWSGAMDKIAHLPLNPLISPDTGGRVSITDEVQNVLLFIPFGALGILAAGSRRRSSIPRLIAVTGLALALSASVETLQLFSADRVTSVGDVTTNVIGAILGGLTAIAGRGAVDRAMRRLRTTGITDTEAFYPAMAFAILLCVAAWEPFDVTLDVGTVVSKLRMLHHDVWQYGGVLTDEGVEIVRYAVFGAFAAAWLRAIGRHRTAIEAAAIGVIAAFALEGCQILIFSRMPALEDATVHASGALLGVALWTMRRRIRSSRVWIVALVLATATASAIQNLSPFTLEVARRPMWWFPFLGYYLHTTFETVSTVIELMLIYFPVGFCMARVWPRSRAAGWAVLVTLAIAFPLEWSKGWIVSRYPDVTNVAVSAAGAWFGAWAGRFDGQFFAARPLLDSQRDSP
jgi:glycopeptide antibiotics resistance protein